MPIIGIDLGTSSLAALLWDAATTDAATSSAAHFGP
jgi:sugar (pentulose or hexulose) kinase